MKKLMILGLAALLVGATSVAAQSVQKPTPQAQAGTRVGPNFVDANGDGICDYHQNGTRPARVGAGRHGGYGPGDGSGNAGVGPKDGTGFGAGRGAGTGICDGTGPKGPRGPRR
jgi:hypothetical protein